MKVIYENKVKGLGAFVDAFESERMFILFGDNAPPELKDYTYHVSVNPINGEQCGLCRACEVKMLNDMEWLVTEKAQKRFRKRWFLWQHFGKRFADAVCNRVYR